MASNKITIIFDPCEPTPANGYRVTYRRVGTTDYLTWPVTFMTSPAQFTVSGPAGASYEGFIVGDCGDGKLGVPIPWSAENGESFGSGSGSGSGSASESGGSPPLSNAFKVGTTSENVCDPGVAVLWWAGPGAALVPGNTMFTDSGLTTPLTGFNFISDSVGTEIFNIDSGTGVVGATTGVGC